MTQADPLRPQTRPDYDGRTPRFIRFSAIVLALTGLAALASIVYSATGTSDTPPGQVPRIAADSGPIRERPLDAGGMTVPNRDSTVYDMMSGNGPGGAIERLLPPPEAPVEVPQPVADAVNPPVPGVIPEPRRTDGQLALTAEEIRQLHQQRRQRMSTGDAAIESMNRLDAAPPPGEMVQEVTPEAVATLDAATPEPVVTLIAPQQPPLPQAAAPEPVTTPPKLNGIAPAAGAAGQPAAVAGNANRYVQLGAVKSEAAANAGWKKLQKAYPRQLGSLNLSIKKIDLGEKGAFWRIRGGPLTAAQAAQVCNALKASQTDCIVAK